MPVVGAEKGSDVRERTEESVQGGTDIRGETVSESDVEGRRR